MTIFAIVTITRRNPVSAVMSLVATFFGLAAIYASLSAHFLAVIQVLVYAGAIMVLFIFVVMILNREEVAPLALRPMRLLGVAAAVYLLFVFADVVNVGVTTAAVPAVVPDTYGTVGVDRGHPVPRVPLSVRGDLPLAAGRHRRRRGGVALAPERGRRESRRRLPQAVSRAGEPRLPGQSREPPAAAAGGHH